MRYPIFRYSLPALLLGAIGGYFVGNGYSFRSVPSHLAEKAHTPAFSGGKKATLREQFLAERDDGVDYEKLARVCIAASAQTPCSSGARTAILAEPGSPEVNKVKTRLDDVMSKSLGMGEWSRSAGLLTENLLRRLPPRDVADFESLLRKTIDRGDLQVQPGAWVPKAIN